MMQSQVGSPDYFLAVLLFNTGLAATQSGRDEEAREAFQCAARLYPKESQFAVASCKACFALGRYEEAETHLADAQAAGASEQSVKVMSRAIRRAATVDASTCIPTRLEPGSIDQPGASWILAFCDRLEGSVHEFCQNLRESIARD